MTQQSKTPRFTLGMCVHNDIDGVYFSCQGNRLLNPIIDSEGEIIIIDNQPDSPDGKQTKKFSDAASKVVRYIPYTEKQSTSIRNLVFDHARAPIVICIDSHVLLPTGGIQAVLNYLEDPHNQNSPKLVQGPMYDDQLDKLYTHWNDLWNAGMQGRWELDNRAIDPNGKPYPIYAQGLGCFAARKEHWLRFNENFRGFGGEEVYIHNKYRKAGGECICIPAFRWVHRFYRAQKVKYIDGLDNRLFNYLVGAFELQQDTAPILEYFRSALSESRVFKIYNQALRVATVNNMQIEKNG